MIDVVYFCKNYTVKPILSVLLSLTMLSSCIRTGVFEKNVTFREHHWAIAEKPVIRFDIQDTSASYRLFFVLRHTDAYRYNNIWIKVNSTTPGDSIPQTQTFDLPLATQNKWNGTAMDDIIEQRILLSRRALKVRKPGTYTFTLEHLMREDPLKEVLNAGIRLEKTTMP